MISTNMISDYTNYKRILPDKLSEYLSELQYKTYKRIALDSLSEFLANDRHKVLIDFRYMPMLSGFTRFQK